MFLPNKHSFLLVRSVTKKKVILPGVPEFTTSLSSSSSDSDRKMFLPNEHSFLSARSAILNLVRRKMPKASADAQEHQIVNGVKPVIQYSIQESNRSEPVESATSLSRPKVGDQDLVLEPSSSDPGEPTVSDKNKRTFLKVAGIAGASIIASLFLPKKADALIMGSAPTTGVVGVKNATNARINPATEETVSSLLKPSDLTFDAGSLQVKVTSVSGAGSSSFSDAGGVAKSGLVDVDRHVQVDVLSSTLPSSASTETTLQTISFGGFKFTLRLATVGDVDYVGEAAIGTATSAASWRIKKVDSTSGIIITWAGTGVFDQVWDNHASLSYS